MSETSVMSFRTKAVDGGYETTVVIEDPILSPSSTYVRTYYHHAPFSEDFDMIIREAQDWLDHLDQSV